MRSAFDGLLQILEHDNAGSFSEHEAIAIRAERLARALGRVVLGRQDSHFLPRIHHDRGDRSISAARDHSIGVTITNQVKRLSNGVCAR